MTAFEAIDDRWTIVSVALTFAPLPSTVCLAATPQRTLIVDGLQLTSGFNRTGEAATQASVVPPDATECWVYGIALGDAITQLLMRDTMKMVNIVVMSRSIARASLEFEPHGWVHSPRVTMHLARDVAGLPTPYTVSPVECKLADSDAHQLRDRIAVQQNAEFNATNMAVRRDLELAQYEKNREFIAQDGPVIRLFDSGSKSAIVIGGGPSLSRQYGWIKDHDHDLIICASTALGPLLGAEIWPDYVLVVDPAPAIAKHFDGISHDHLRRATLVYIPTCYPAVVRDWPGPRAMAHVNIDDPGSDLFSGGSVIHACTDLAVKMGCKTVYVAGADFSYPGGESHVAGAANPYEVGGENSGWRMATTNGHGVEVLTDDALVQYRLRLAEYVAKHPEVKFYKLGREGLPVDGMEWVDDT